MLNYIKENKQVMMVAITLFVLSMSSVMFFFGTNEDLNQRDLQTDIVEVINNQDSGITDSVQLKANQEQEAKYRKLINNYDDNIFVINIDGTITFTSWNVETCLSYKQNELNNEMFFLLVHSDDLSTFMSAYSGVIQNKKPVYNIGPYRIRDEKGNYRMHITSLFPIITDGKVAEVVIASKDISNDMNQYKKDGSVTHPKPAKKPPTKVNEIPDQSGFRD